MPQLTTVLNAGYGNLKAKKELEKQNYILDKNLSNNNNFVYVNNNEKKFIHNIKGTNPFSFDDLKTDIVMGLFGTGKKGLKSTDRYKDSNRILINTKNKYPNFQSSITGHSLGSSIGMNIANKETDKFAGLNGYYMPFKGTPSNNGQFKHYRTQMDPISVFASNKKNVMTLPNKYNPTGVLPLDLLKSHSVSSIGNKNIFV